MEKMAGMNQCRVLETYGRNDRGSRIYNLLCSGDRERLQNSVSGRQSSNGKTNHI